MKIGLMEGGVDMVLVAGVLGVVLIAVVVVVAAVVGITAGVKDTLEDEQ